MDKNAKKPYYVEAEIQVVNFCISDVLTTSSSWGDVDDNMPDGTWQ